MSDQLKTIIVTGGTGFLGSHLIPALQQQGYTVKNIDVRPSDLCPTIVADVRDQEKMIAEIKNADAVFHLASLIEAGESVKEPQKFIDHNISGTLAVLEAMRINGISTFLFSSSAAVYGEPLSIPIQEDDRTIPINPYGMTKLAMEGLLSSYVKAHNFTGVALRYFNLYGPKEHHQPETHALPRFIKQIYDGTEVTVWGDGSHLRDYIHITDVVEGHLQALTFALKPENQHRYHYFNLSTEKPSTVLDIVKIVETTLKKKAHIKHFPERLGDPQVLYASSLKAREQLGWQARITLEVGVTETVEYYLSLWKQQ
jgi:nucleoside-diphosphate-sugar epimerase